ncbi:MAG: hypothetical protein WB522_21070, partial [Pseudolabrys sp.]
LLYPRKRTFAATFGMSANCQKRTSAAFGGIVRPNALAVFQVDDQIEFDRGSFQRQIVRVGTLQQAIYNASWAHP